MRALTWRAIKAMVDGPLHLLSRRQRIHLGRHILDTALGDNNSNEESNGEYWVLERVKQHLLRTPATPTVVFDVGARIGEWSLCFAAGMGAKVSVYAFEPTNKSYEQLRHSFGAHDDDANTNARAKLVPVNVALSDRAGSAEMFISGDTAGTNSLYKAVGSYVQPIGNETVTLATGDEFCRQHGIERIAFLKIDTEGHEVSVMRGLTGMLEAGRVDCVQFEYNLCWIDSRTFLGDAFAFLRPKGYLLAKVHPRGLEFFDQYDQQLERFRYCNFLAIRPEWRGLFEEIR